MSDFETDVKRTWGMVYQTCACGPNKGLKVMAAAMDHAVEKGWGKKCPDYEKDCGCCEAWKAWEEAKKVILDGTEEDDYGSQKK